MKKIGLTILACCLAVLVINSSALGMSSANYRVDEDVLSSGGGAAASANYSNYATLGQPTAIGSSTSANYANSGGFLQDESVLRSLMITLAGSGTGSVSPDSGSILWTGNTGTAYYADGSTATLTASAGANSDFIGWSGACTGTGSCIITMSTNTAATATFNANAYAIATAVSAGSGTVTCSPNPVTPGGTSTCTITPSTGYSLLGLIVDSSSVASAATYSFTNVNANHTISASFSANLYNLSIITSGTGTGRVTSSPAGINCPGTCSFGFPYNSSVILSATTPTGSTFMGWSGSGCGGTGTCSFMITSAATVTARFNDTQAPVLVISALPDNSSTNNPVFNINGTVTDNREVQSLTVSGVSVTVQPDHTFNTALVLTSGTNTITTIASDYSANTTTDIRRITLDQTAPTLTITMPADNSITSQGTITLAGTVESDAALSTSVNSGPTITILFTGTSYTTNLNLTSGLNGIDVTARDAAGNSTSSHRTVTYDSSAPSLAITTPPHDTVVTSATITISGTVSDAITNAPAVALSFNTTTYTPAVIAGVFSQQITFPAQGRYSVTVMATDEAGNSGTVIRNIIYENIPGDVNNNGALELSDVLTCFRYYRGRVSLTDAQKLSCDVAPLGSDGKPSPDDKVDAKDVILLLRRMLGLVSW